VVPLAQVEGGETYVFVARMPRPCEPIDWLATRRPCGSRGLSGRDHEGDQRFAKPPSRPLGHIAPPHPWARHRPYLRTPCARGAKGPKGEGGKLP
jgi:hypothetical protein